MDLKMRLVAYEHPVAGMGSIHRRSVGHNPDGRVVHQVDPHRLTGLVPYDRLERGAV